MIESIREELCLKCRRCIKVCPKDILGWNSAENRPEIIYPYECQTCFQCRIVCESKAIIMNANRKKGENYGRV